MWVMIFDFSTSAPKLHDLESSHQLIADLCINGAELSTKLAAQN